MAEKSLFLRREIREKSAEKLGFEAVLGYRIK
jgi:hypothetical protein